MRDLFRKSISLALAVTLATAGGGSALALDTSLQYVLTLTGDVERRQVRYECDGREDLLTVEYVNAAPNYLAILTMEDEPLVFASVISGSGVRYASGFYVWWTSGSEASLYDLRADNPDTAEFTCLEFNDIP